MNGFQVGSIYSRQTIAFPDGDSGVCEIIDGEIWCWMQAWDYNAIEVEVIPDGRKAISLNGQGGGPYCVILDDGSLSCFSDFDVYDLNFSKTVIQLPDGQKALPVGIGGVSDEECVDDSWACDEVVREEIIEVKEIEEDESVVEEDEPENVDDIDAKINRMMSRKRYYD